MASDNTPQNSRWIFVWTVGISLFLAAGLAAGAGWLRLERGRPAGTRGAAAPLRRVVRLEVVSSPPGCGVRLDGRYVGIAPVSVEDVSPGDHFVEVRRDGYRARTVRVAVDGSAAVKPVSVALAALKLGRIDLSSNPPGATVALDGEDRGNTPMVLEGIHPGVHRVVLRRARYEPWVKDVEVRGGATARLSAEMEDSFLKFLKGAVASEPRKMTHRAELFHYMMTRKNWKAAGDSFFDALSLMARQGVADAAKGGLWYWFARDAASLRQDKRDEFGTVFGGRLAELASQDVNAAARVLKYLGARASVRSRRRRNPELLRRVYFTAAVRCAAYRPLVEAALGLAVNIRSAAEVKRLLAAAAKARPGDGKHTGWLAVRVVNLIKAGEVGGSFRGEALAAAAGFVEKALAGERKDAALKARLRRMLSKILALQDKAGQALAELDKAIAELKAADPKAAAGRLETWRLERAVLLVGLKRVEEAKRILKALATGAARAEVRERAAARLKELTPVPK